MKAALYGLPRKFTVYVIATSNGQRPSLASFEIFFTAMTVRRPSTNFDN